MLTPAQQAEAERNRILSTLEATPGERKRAAKAPAGAAPWKWAVSGLLLALVAGGAGLWYGQQGGAPAPLAAAETVAVAEPVAEPIAASASATIQDDGAARAEPETQQSLSEMLAATPESAPTEKASADVLSEALEAPSAAAAAATVAAAPLAAKVAARPAPAKAKPPVKSAPAPKAKPKPAAPPDGDVMLLSALIAHAQAAEPAGQKKVRASLEQELAYCKKQPKAAFAACRTRACDGRATAAACKVKR